MLKYLIILLDDTSTSYCHYHNNKTEKLLISLEDLKAGILFAMKENLTIQFVYPAYEIPAAYQEAIETIDHVKIMPADAKNTMEADVLVFNGRDALQCVSTEQMGKIFVLRTCVADVVCNAPTIPKNGRLNIIITDFETFTEKDFETYKQWLSELVAMFVETHNCASLQENNMQQINLLTDRIILYKMNNCNAGIENITLAPNGEFYICPAFYIENEKDSIGNLKKGVDIKNRQLYKLEYAPLCRTCDAYQCKRCVWLNRKTTLEVNTPSHEQCVVAHLERNASRQLLNELQRKGYFTDREILPIDYLDPFEGIEN